jgi:hypothetical protein
MAEPVKGAEEAIAVAAEVPAVNPSASSEALVHARFMDGERLIARILRFGALTSGGLLALSIVLEAVPASFHSEVAVDYLRKGAVSLLVVTPVARLVAAGALLALRGEYRYALYASGIVALLGLALGAGFHA